MLFHTFAPVYDEKSRVLILGSFPSVKSREEGFYYGHPRNRFWAVLARIYGCEPPTSVADKRALLLANRVALWDVCAACEVEGSSDASISGVVPNDLTPILSAAKIERIYTNGKTADDLYRKLILPQTGINAVCLPSTSPANAAWNLDKLTAEWRKIDIFY